MTSSSPNLAVPDVSVVIVSMNNPEELFPCLDCFRANPHSAQLEIWVVAYLFSPENLQNLKNGYPEVRIIESNEIRGFSENNNLALRRATGNFCLIINDDTSFERPIADLLLQSFETRPNATIFSPLILNPDGSVQVCGRIPYTVQSSLLNGFHIRDASRVISPYINQAGIFQTYNISGAAFMIRTTILKELGYFDEQYFFCPEDVALSTLANERGYACFVNADIILTHKASGTLRRTAEATFPAMARGTVLFQGRNSKTKSFVYSTGIFVLALIKYLVAIRKPTPERTIWRNAWLNTMKAAFSKKTPKELFTRYYQNVPEPTRGKK